VYYALPAYPEDAMWKLVSLLVLLSFPALATTYYVSPTGRDTNAGTSTTAPFLTIQHAAQLTHPGDIVDVMTGSYGPLNIPHSGTAAAWITYQAYPGQHPVVNKTDAVANGIQLGTSNRPVSYITIQGFTIVGNAGKYTLAQAMAQTPGGADWRFNGSCIDAYPADHHIKIIGNDVSLCPGTGILAPGDYIWIYGNNVHNNAYWSPTARSGITIKGTNSDTSPAAKIFVFDNAVHDNQQYVCSGLVTTPTCWITDGQGIIVDTNNSTLTKDPTVTFNPAAGYSGRVEIYNNVSYHNGGRGIIAHRSQHVDIYNNTTFWNDLTPDQQASGGEIVVTHCDDVRVENNIEYGNPVAAMSYPIIYAGTNVVFDYNVLFNGLAIAPIGPHDLVGDPSFDPVGPYNFHLLAGSIAVWTGEGTLVPAADFDGYNRASLGPPTRGAFAKYINPAM
jgi:hypothetical protein